MGFEQIGKNKNFRKVGKNSGETAELKLVFFLNSWVPRKRGKGRYSRKYEKCENHCTLMYTGRSALGIFMA